MFFKSVVKKIIINISRPRLLLEETFGNLNEIPGRPNKN